MASFQFVVQAAANSVSGGAPLNTGITVAPGDLLTISENGGRRFAFPPYNGGRFREIEWSRSSDM